MGYNTTVVILNDALGDIAEDKDFGKKLAAACNKASMEREEHITFPSGSHCNPVHVVESHHADDTVLIAVGGNYGRPLGTAYGLWRKEETEEVEKILKAIADQLGYKLVKKSASR